MVKLKSKDNWFKGKQDVEPPVSQVTASEEGAQHCSRRLETGQVGIEEQHSSSRMEAGPDTGDQAEDGQQEHSRSMKTRLDEEQYSPSRMETGPVSGDHD